MNLKRYTSTIAVLAAVFLLISAAPASAAHAAIVSSNSTATELGAGSLTNAEVERSDSAGLVGHDLARSSAAGRWAFDNGSGSTAYDHVGSNDGTITGATWTSGVSGKALDFDGSSDTVDLPESASLDLSGTTDATVAAWVNPDTAATANGQRIVAIGSTVVIGITASGEYFGYAHDGSSFNQVNGPSVTTGAWQHVAVTYDGANVRLYVNGKLEGTTPATGNLRTYTGNNAIGSRGDGARELDGQIDDPRVYSEALTPGQVERLYMEPAAKQSSVASERWAGDVGLGETAYGDEGNSGTIQGAGDEVLAWSFNEGMGETVHDFAGTFDGSFSGNPEWTAGKRGQALDFDGSNDYVTAGSTRPVAAGSYSISFWVNLDGTGQVRPVSQWGSNHDFLFLYDSGNGQMEFILRDGNSQNVQTEVSDSEFSPGTWHHFVGVADQSNSELRLYLDGTLVDTVAWDGTHSTGGDPFYIGEQSTGEGDLDGQIDDVKVYDSALTTSAVSDLYANPEGRLVSGSFNGEHYGNEWVAGQSGQAIHFEGESEAVDIPEGLVTESEDFSTSIWIKPSETPATQQRPLTLRGDIQFTTRITSSGDIEVWSGTWHTVKPATIGAWQHLIVTYDESSTTWSAYVDGVKQTTWSVDSASEANDNILGSAINSVNHFNGSVDDVRIYSGTTLTDADAKYLYDHPGAQLNESSSYQATHDATNTVGAEAELDLQNATATLTWEGSSDGGSSWTTLDQVTVSSSQTVSGSWSEFAGDDVRLTVDYEATAPDHYARLQEESVEAQTKDPAVDDASLAPNSTSSTVSSTPIQLSADISDVDFAAEQGDQITAKWYVDGNLEDTTTHSSNGTISTTVGTVAAGSHTWHLELTDSYGNGPISSATADFVLPSELTVYNESNATQVIDGDVSLELRFYGATNTTRVYEVPVNNGVADMEGLPANEEFVVVAKASGYYDRRIYVSSLVEQQRVYLLPDDQQNFTAVFNVFTLVDRSGTYPAGETRLIIQRALNTSGSGLAWTTIAGDFFGATNEFPVYLRYEQRYRIIVENDAGDRREIGAYTAADENNPKPITIKSIIVDPPEGQEYYGTAWVEDETDNDGEETFRFTYSDPTGETEELTLRVHERGNESKEIINKTITNVGTEYAFSYTLKNSSGEYGKAWQVTWSADRGDGHDSDSAPGGSFPVGHTGTIFIPFDPEWLARFGLVALPVVAALASERIATLGALGTVVLAGLLMVTGLWEIPVVLWIAALVIALGGHALTMAKRGSVFG